MDDSRVIEFVELLTACHGVGAEDVARERIDSCMRRGESEWAELYRKVAEEISKRLPKPDCR